MITDCLVNGKIHTGRPGDPFLDPLLRHDRKEEVELVCDTCGLIDKVLLPCRRINETKERHLDRAAEILFRVHRCRRVSCRLSNEQMIADAVAKVSVIFK